MEIGESKDGEVTVLAPKGSLNTQTSPKLEQKLVATLGEKTRLIVIDFRGVDYLSSAALRVLLMITRRLKRVHGCLILCGMSEDLKKVFAISGFDRDFTIVHARGEAVAMAAALPPPGTEPEAKAPKEKPSRIEAPAPPPEPAQPAPPAEPSLAERVAGILSESQAAAWASWPATEASAAKRVQAGSILASGL